MYESDDIIKYLFDTYGDGQVPSSLTGGVWTALSAGIGGAARYDTHTHTHIHTYTHRAK